MQGRTKKKLARVKSLIAKGLNPSQALRRAKLSPITWYRYRDLNPLLKAKKAPVIVQAKELTDTLASLYRSKPLAQESTEDLVLFILSLNKLSNKEKANIIRRLYST